MKTQMTVTIANANSGVIDKDKDGTLLSEPIRWANIYFEEPINDSDGMSFGKKMTKLPIDPVIFGQLRDLYHPDKPLTVTLDCEIVTKQDRNGKPVVSLKGVGLASNGSGK